MHITLNRVGSFQMFRKANMTDLTEDYTPRHLFRVERAV